MFKYQKYKLLYELLRSNKIVKIQWIPSHIIPENDAIDLLAKLAGSSSNSITDLNLEQEEHFSVLL